MTKHPSSDITLPSDIKLLVDTFYNKVLQDTQIGFIFTDIAHISLEHHMPVMYQFWESTLVGTGAYTGNPMTTHIQLHHKTPLTPEHFSRWLVLWTATVNELFIGPMATEAIQRAQHIAGLMQFKLQSSLH